MFEHFKVPPKKTAIDYIKEHTGWESVVKSLGDSRFEPTLTVPSLDIDASGLLSEIYQLYRHVGARAWRSQKALGLYGLSLSYNPSHARFLWPEASFGDPRYQAFSGFDYFQAVERDQKNRVKDDYLDSLGFRKLLPEVNGCQILRALLARSQLPLVRSTVRTLNGSVIHPTPRGDGGYHVDDSPFEVLRINIQLSGFDDYGIQYKGCEPLYRAVPQALVINTDRLHRVYVRRPNDVLRTSLVLGFTPWLSYDASTDSWAPNQYFGRIHPYDMVREGLIFGGDS